MPPVPSAKSIHIALTFDDSFWAPAYATMRSICLATSQRNNLVFHICHRPLSTAHRADLMEIETEFGATLCFYDLTTTPEFLAISGRVPQSKRLTDIVYARFVMDRFLPETVERLIYLDCDMMVMAPIEELWHADLEDKVIGAVLDPWGKLIGSGRDIKTTSDLLDPAEPYFNAGLMVMDLVRWRSENIAEQMEALILGGTVARLNYSQNVINLILGGKWQRLADRWNIVDPTPAHVSYNPSNLHYTGTQRPWHLLSRAGYARQYRHVMTNALFYRYLHFRILKRVSKFLPFVKAN
ncbi:glycosyltransferase family 8 protein [Pelagibacterium sp.]|uniref:glycosyltransferase family 8 protein n=1 Tax=Pelagibacterium sp. TaxID=1967288 RepID=UPI003A8DBC58